MRNVSLGFNPRNLLTAEISIPNAQYDTYEKVETFYHALATRLAAIPGVKEATLGDVIPLGASVSGISGFGGCASVFIEDHPLQSGESAPCVGVPTGAPGYFHALGIKVRGSEPSWTDVEARTGGVIVTKSLAARLWPGQDAIGKGIRGNGDQPPYYRVVGVADDFRATGLDKPPADAVFFPLLPLPKVWLWSPRVHVTILLRTNGVPPQTLMTPLRRVLTSLDPNVPLANVRTMEDVVAQSMVRLSFTMTLLGIAAVMALILSAIGVYGVISYIVGRRTSEIGIRMALGAHASRVGTLVVLQSLQLATIGVVVGILCALGLTRALRSVLFDVNPTDPVTFASVSVIMLIIAGLAAFVPAQRAMRVDPVEALRAD
jgi:predicted permease